MAKGKINWPLMAALMAQIQSDLAELKGKITDDESGKIIERIDKSAEEVISAVMPEVRKQLGVPEPA
jgi:hypothetical protein